MKIGILTFSNAYNYGAVLQCYAMYNTLTSIGCDTYIINYCPKYMHPTFPRPPIRKFLHLKIREGLLSFFDAIKHYRRFHDFVLSEFRLSPKCSNFSQIEREVNNYDYIFLGSDQVWTRKHNKFDSAWYGGYGQTKWIGYAVSAGDCLFQDDEKKRIQKKLQNFESFSVREHLLSRYISTLTNRNVPVVLDPTLLVDKKIWDKWTKPLIKEKYILIYQARQTDIVFQIANILSKELGRCKIIPICGWPNVYRSGYKRYIASPADFISLINNAEYVLTTSFHATVFSIILKKKFYTIKLNDGSDYRCEHLLHELGLDHRLVDSVTLPISYNIDYQSVFVKLNKKRMESLDFIKKSIHI